MVVGSSHRVALSPPHPGARSRPSAATPALAALVAAEIDHTVHAYPHDPGVASYGQEAVEALGVPAACVYKTLLVGDDRGRLAVGIVPALATLDLNAMASALGRKRVAMADPAVVERSTGYVVGGLSPFGQRRRLPTVLDEAAAAHDRMYVSAGRRGLEVSVAPGALVDLLGATLAPIGREDRSSLPRSR